MALLDEILHWSQKSLRPWQQDALRRLFQHSLDHNALDDLYAMLKQGVGLPDEKNRIPEPLSQNHLPTTTSLGDAAILLRMREVKHVNRLLDNQILEFSPKGLTIIYGANGSGKSGYARVLKRACRSRDAAEQVRPNALLKVAEQGIPSAVFDIEQEGTPYTVSWARGNAPPPQLASIAVFDTHCARAYLDEKQEIAYLPFGLDMIEGLAQIVLPSLTDKLKLEIEATLTAKDAFNHLLGATKVGELIQGLSPKTEAIEVTSLATVSVEELELIESLNKTLNENDPKARANAVQLTITRLGTLLQKLEVAYSWVKEDSIEKLKAIDTITEASILVQLNSAAALRAGEELLPGTGDPVWQALFRSARQFSIEAAYVEQSFPNTDSGAKCVLCQTELTEESAARLLRFEEFVQADVAKDAAEKIAVRNSAISKIRDANIAVEIEEALCTELNLLDASIVEEIKLFNETVQQRKEWLLAAQVKHTFDDYPQLSNSPIPKLKEIIAAQNFLKDGFEKATNDQTRIALEKQLAELKARAGLQLCHKSVLDLLERMRVKALLIQCQNDLKTQPISAKAKELASATITTALRDALQDEFNALKVTVAIPRLDEKVEKGKMLHKLELDLETASNIKDILSEGEQRAIAIGSFLAELRTGDHKGGIVFDDPVSSLDHFRRKHVATRLVEESQVRQVIIFTHDTSFLGEIRDLVEAQNLDYLVHHLEWEGNFSGRINIGLPWHHQTYKARIDGLEQNQSKLKKAWQVYPSEKLAQSMRNQYSRLRETIERVIQEVVFNGVVARYRDWIKVNHLGEVVGFDSSEHSELVRLYDKCHGIIVGHDAASDKNASVPSPDELGIDIEALKTVIEVIKTRQSLNKPNLPKLDPTTAIGFN